MGLHQNSVSPRRRNKRLEDKVAKLINAWLIYLDLASLVNAKVEAGDEEDPNIWDKGVAIVGNSLKLEEGLFKQLKAEAAKAREKNNAFQIAVAFPKIYKVEDNRRQFQPLFTVDISSIFEGNFRKTGWNLTERFEFQPILPNLIDVAEIDEEKIEQLVTREGLRTFLEDTFKHSFKTLQDFLNLLVLPDIPQTVQPLPYLLRFDFVPYTYNLKKDLKKILDQQQYWDWVSWVHPAFEYLFGRPEPPEHSVWYAGAFPTHAPTDSQVRVFKHLRRNTLTAVVGPPGCGKTISLSHGIAMLVSDRALHLIESGQDESNLSLITSTNNRAVQNLEALLEDDPTLSFLFLPGGSKDVIRERSLPQLQKAMLWLQETPFNESEQQATAKALRQKVNQLHSELAQDEVDQQERQNLTRKLEVVQQQIASLQASLAALNLGNGVSNPFGDYSQFPLEAYRQIESLLSTARNSDSSAGAKLSAPSNWLQRLYQLLQRLWNWLIQRCQRTDFYDQLNRLATQVQATPFPIQFQLPLNDQTLSEQQAYVSTQIKAAQAWQTVDRITVNLNQQNNRHSQLKRQLAAYPKRDFYSRFYTEDLHGLQQEIFQQSQQYLRQEALRRKNEVRNSLELYARILEGNDQDGLVYRRFAREWRTVYRDLSLLFPVLTESLR